MRPERSLPDLGSAVITPDTPVIACKPGHWDITYTCGKRGIASGGGIRFDIPYGFSPPQSMYSSEVGFIVLETSSEKAKVVLQHRDPKTEAWNQGTFAVHVYALVEDAPLSPGETVTLRYGRGHGGGLTGIGAFARYFEGEAEFTVLVDPDGKREAPKGGFWLLDTPQPRLTVIGDTATHLHVTIPSLVTAGDDMTLKVTARDQHLNTDESFARDLVIDTLHGPKHIPGSELAKGSGSATLVLPAPSSEVGHIRVHESEYRVQGRSNPCVRKPDSSAPNLYWGDTHIMTEISAGLGRPRSALIYARDKSHLDFAAITDGDDADGYYTDEEWTETVAAVNDLYKPGEFATILASECHERRVAGDKNIYYRTGEHRLIRWSDLEGEMPYAIWEALAGEKAMTITHHPVSGSGGLKPWDHYHADFMRLVEIYSIWGNSECEGCARPNYWNNNYNNSVQNALAKGYRLGIIASGDSHDGLAGNSSWMRLRKGHYNGVAAVYAPELTREAIFDGLYDRYCYGTTGARIILSFDLNDARMGQELTSEGDRKSRGIRVRAVGTAPIANITVIRNGVEVRVQQGNGEDESFEWEDREPFDAVSLNDCEGNPFIYYYVRVSQVDGEIAWSSPVWVT